MYVPINLRLRHSSEQYLFYMPYTTMVVNNDKVLRYRVQHPGFHTFGKRYSRNDARECIKVLLRKGKNNLHLYIKRTTIHTRYFLSTFIVVSSTRSVLFYFNTLRENKFFISTQIITIYIYTCIFIFVNAITMRYDTIEKLAFGPENE